MQRLSQYRVRMRDLVKEEQRIVQLCMDKKVLVKGSVFKMHIKCGKVQCKCHRKGQLHTAWRLSRSHKGQPQSRYLSMKEVVEYKKLTGNYRRFRQARARLVKIYREKMELLDMIEKAKSKEAFK